MFIVIAVIVDVNVKIFPDQIWLYCMHYHCFITDCAALNKCNERWIYSNIKCVKKHNSLLFCCFEDLMTKSIHSFLILECIMSYYRVQIPAIRMTVHGCSSSFGISVVLGGATLNIYRKKKRFISHLAMTI